jgi:hypothetical protein
MSTRRTVSIRTEGLGHPFDVEAANRGAGPAAGNPP